MERNLKNIIVTGGAGFIGSNFIRYVFEKTDFDGKIINVDALTYAGNPFSLSDIEEKFGGKSYFFEKADICDYDRIDGIMKTYDVDTIVHFAAESHVDRSITGPAAFIETNINGTFNLLEAARKNWGDRKDVLFHHVSTDEVFGSLGETGFFSETTAYDPKSPYSSSKAASDHLVRSHGHTFGLPFTLSNCSNNYGPFHFPEKLIPLMLLNITENKELPVYGDGKNIRDWLYVEDHASAIWTIINKGKTGETYCVGGENEWENIKLVHVLCEKMAERLGKSVQEVKSLITFVKDRPGHDQRYAIDCTKIKTELGWKQSVNFAEGLEKTIDWFMSNSEWIENVKSGAYKDWVESNYTLRG